jgi:replicative DNA helicase
MTETPTILDAEQSALSAVFLDPRRIDDLREAGLDADHFEDARCRAVFRAMIGVAESGLAIDPPTILATLRTQEDRTPVDADFVGRLIAYETSAANAGWYAAQVVEAATKRRLHQLGRRIVAESGNGRAAAEIVERATADLDGLAASGNMRSATVGDVARRMTFDGTGAAEYIRTGLRAVDKALGGLALGELIVIGGWSGHGKSALACQLALTPALASDPIPVAIISLEMRREVIVERLMANVAGVSIARLRRGGLHDDEVRRVARHSRELVDAPLHICDQVHTIGEVLAESRRLIRRRGVRVLVIDYLQIVRSPADRRHLQLEEITSSLLGLAVNEGVAVIAASQLRKQAAAYHGRPTMHDLRESGSLFECPHAVLLVYRPDLGRVEECPMCHGRPFDGCVCGGTGGKSLDTTARILVEKNRSGPTGTLRLAWRGEHLQFTNLEGDRPE